MQQKNLSTMLYLQIATSVDKTNTGAVLNTFGESSERHDGVRMGLPDYLDTSLN